MRRIRSRYLDDGRGFNQGQAATLIEVEGPEDLDVLHETLFRSNYYGSDYFRRHHRYPDGALVGHFWALAEIARHLRPRRVLEIGCGRGDVLAMLLASGIEVHGIDVSLDILDQAWPAVRPFLRGGDLLQVLEAHQRHQPHVTFDLVCGFDIWEHFHPHQLPEYVDRVIDVSSDEALFFFVIPAFGNDPVFGEQFPLEFEENREDFEQRTPFRYLLADAEMDTVPAQGHLTWAHTDWWQRLFLERGLSRMPEVERPFHQFLDPLLPHSVKAFYLFRRDTDAAAERARRLETSPYDKVAFTKSVARLVLTAEPLGSFEFVPDVRSTALRHWRQLLTTRLRRQLRARPRRA